MGGEDDKLALLVAVGEDLKAIGDDGQELDIVALQEDDHALKAAGEAHRHLRAILMEKQIMQSRDGVEEHRLNV